MRSVRARVARRPPAAAQGRLGCLVAVSGKIEIDRSRLTFWAMMRSVRFNSPLYSLLRYLKENSVSISSKYGPHSTTDLHSFAKPHAHIALIISPGIHAFP